MKIAIHQPNFCPTKGYFDKIAAVDLFVIMVHCQWEKGKYQNRFHVGDQWNTMSVNHGLEPVNKKVYTNYEKDWAIIVSRYPKLKVFDDLIKQTMWITNVHIILKAMMLIGIKKPIAFDYDTEMRGTERLVGLCKTNGATEYLSGKSGRKYLDLKQFEDAGIKVSFQDEPDLTPLIDLI